MIDLEIIAVDGKSVNFKENPFETIYFVLVENRANRPTDVPIDKI